MKMRQKRKLVADFTLRLSEGVWLPQGLFLLFILKNKNKLGSQQAVGGSKPMEQN